MEYKHNPKLMFVPSSYSKSVMIGSPIVGTSSQVADLGSAYVLAPQSLGLPQTEEMFMGVS